MMEWIVSIRSPASFAHEKKDVRESKHYRVVQREKEVDQNHITLSLEEICDSDSVFEIFVSSGHILVCQGLFVRIEVAHNDGWGMTVLGFAHILGDSGDIKTGEVMKFKLPQLVGNGMNIFEKLFLCPSTAKAAKATYFVDVPACMKLEERPLVEIIMDFQRMTEVLARCAYARFYTYAGSRKKFDKGVEDLKKFEKKREEVETLKKELNDPSIPPDTPVSDVEKTIMERKLELEETIMEQLDVMKYREIQIPTKIACTDRGDSFDAKEFMTKKYPFNEGADVAVTTYCVHGCVNASRQASVSAFGSLKNDFPESVHVHNIVGNVKDQVPPSLIPSAQPVLSHKKVAFVQTSVQVSQDEKMRKGQGDQKMEQEGGKRTERLIIVLHDCVKTPPSSSDHRRVYCAMGTGTRVLFVGFGDRSYYAFFEKPRDLLIENKMDRRFSEMGNKMDKRFSEMDRRFSEMKEEMKKGFSEVKEEMKEEMKEQFSLLINMLQSGEMVPKKK